MEFDILPHDCLSLILSLTSPKDVCCVSLLSSSLKSVAESDNAWHRFLPSDYEAILSTMVSHFIFSSKKELFIKLCDPCLIHGGKRVILFFILHLFPLFSMHNRNRYIEYT